MFTERGCLCAVRGPMGAPSLKDNEVHWRQCAEEARGAAGQSADPITKKTLLEIAAAYEQLASLAAAKVASKLSG